MANISKNVPAKKTSVQLIAETNKQGTSIEYLAIDGQKIGIMGYMGEEDKNAALRFIQNIVDNSDKKGFDLYMEIMNTAMLGGAMHDKGICAADSEEVNIHGIDVLLNYKEKKAYVGVNLDLKEIANLNDLTCNMPKEAVKALLIERANNKLLLMREAEKALENPVAEDPEDEIE